MRCCLNKSREQQTWYTVYANEGIQCVLVGSSPPVLKHDWRLEVECGDRDVLFVRVVGLTRYGLLKDLQTAI